MKRAILFSAIMGVCGCTYWPQGSTAHILIEEEGFSPTQLREIKDAVAEWNVALNGYVHFEYVYSKGCNDLIVIRSAHLKDLLADETNRYGVTYTEPTENGGAIYLPIDLPANREKYFFPIALHEMGHALSLEHRYGHVIMNPDVVDPNQRITCDDIGQFCEINDCVWEKFPICKPQNYVPTE